MKSQKGASAFAEFFGAAGSSGRKRKTEDGLTTFL
jgi:hypothetical protein